jgi:predicted DsbA family dithiol-disulfide isomerase
MPVHVRYYTDPACEWSWASEPKVRHLQWEFGDELRFSYVMGGLARAYEPGEHAEILGRWLDAAAEGRMPIDPRIWRQNPISSTYPVCQAVKAAGEQGPDAAAAYLRRAREALMVERTKLDHTSALVAEAGAAGLDAERFRIDLGSHATTEAFAADLDDVRAIPDEARDAGAVRRIPGGERLPLPSAVFVGGNGERQGVWGWQPYDAYRDAALATGVASVNGDALEPLDAIERFGRCATRELEELSGRPGPVVEAELWQAAKDWKLRPVKVLTGTLWERA